MSEIRPFEKRIYLSSPTMHGEELKYMKEAYDTNWMSTVGENINEVEKLAAEKVGVKYAVALSCGTAALHLCARLAGVRRGDRVFASDLTFAATVNPFAYEGANLTFIDSERETWNMDPEALKLAFDKNPGTKFVVVANLYGTPAKLDEIAEICSENGAVLIEDAAESLGATYKGRQTGTFGRFNAISFNGNKIITGTSGGMLLTDDGEAAVLARKLSTQSRDLAPWYQHSQIGYNYRMSNVIAGVVRGQFPYLEEHISQKKAIYERYMTGLAGLPVTMNPHLKDSVPNYWLSCILIDRDYMCNQTRGDLSATYRHEKGRSCPTEILEKLASANAEGRPIWKPMHMQPVYADNDFVTSGEDVGADIFERGLCLPSDNKTSLNDVDRICGIIRSCFEE